MGRRRALRQRAAWGKNGTQVVTKAEGGAFRAESEGDAAARPSRPLSSSLSPRRDADGWLTHRGTNNAGLAFFSPLGFLPQTTPLIVGLATAAAALTARQAILSGSRYLATPRLRKHYEGGFQGVMTRREAALVLGIRESSPHDRIKEKHKKVAGEYRTRFLSLSYLTRKPPPLSLIVSLFFLP